MISVSEALDHLFDLANPVDTELVPLRKAAGRILRKNVVSPLNQPPFAASAMDGYAVRDEDIKTGAILTVIGESAAGQSGRRGGNDLSRGRGSRRNAG